VQERDSIRDARDQLQALYDSVADQLTLQSLQ